MDKKFQDTVENNRFKRKHISRSAVDKVNQVNLAELLLWVDGNSITYKNGQFVLTADNHVVVYENMAYNHYNGECFNPLNALMVYYGYSFPQAFYVANHFVYKVAKLPIREQLAAMQPDREQHKEQLATDLNYILDVDFLDSPSNMVKSLALARTYAYLCKTRGIDRDLVTHIIKKRLLAMDAAGNLCFLTYRDGNVMAITKKGTNPQQPFKQNLVAEPHTGFFYGSSTIKEFKEVYVFEAIVDLFSYITLAKRGLVPSPSIEDCFVATNGVSRKYLHKVLEENPSIKTVHLCFDNDTAGREAASDFLFYDARYRYRDRLTVDSLALTLVEAKVKDWNEYLKLIENSGASA